ncbi:MAG: 2-amino-4-hydroxy-6-hydroxymethyldihydropteridine diphosphokinase [Muribaculaceae bacterium]|nr:2-amino-4-hydroxy-6-hydroxymethyldihydropteridine diphosphokinase [Muribaculaceae bacterium]
MRYILSIGTNQNPREEHLRRAVSWLSLISETCFVSTPYTTAPIGKDEGNECKHYLNAVAVIEMDDDYTLTTVDRILKAYEAGAGRTAEARAEGRVPIDIDVVIYGDEVVRPKDFDRYFFKQGYEELVSTGVV